MKKFIILLLISGSFLYPFDNHHKVSYSHHQKSKHIPRKALLSTFLIKGGLIHYSFVLKHLWDDKGLGLTDIQKSRLLALRKDTMSRVKELFYESRRLKKDIIEASKKRDNLSYIFKLTDKLASVKAEATKVQLKCIEKTKSILRTGQLKYIEGYITKQKEDRAKINSLKRECHK